MTREEWHQYYKKNREKYLKRSKRYYRDHKEWYRQYRITYAKSHKDYYKNYRKEYAKRYVPKKNYYKYKKKHNGYFLYNDKEEKFFQRQIDAIRFLHTSWEMFKKLLATDMDINGWKGEEAL